VRKPAAGNWYVQLGAFESAGVAKDAWGRATRRFAGFAGHAPNGVTFRANGEDFYRLSVGGFNRREADAVCRRYRAKGGACFVRMGAGDQMAQWVRKSGVQLAAR
jgi:cell division septation protein DedD